MSRLACTWIVSVVENAPNHNLDLYTLYIFSRCSSHYIYLKAANGTYSRRADSIMASFQKICHIHFCTGVLVVVKWVLMCNGFGVPESVV